MGRPHRVDIRRNDQVKVIAGKDVKEVGRVLRVIRSKQRVVVEGINMIKRHTRAQSQSESEGRDRGEGRLRARLERHDRLRSLRAADPNRAPETGRRQEDSGLS